MHFLFWRFYWGWEYRSFHGVSFGALYIINGKVDRDTRAYYARFFGPVFIGRHDLNGHVYINRNHDREDELNYKNVNPQKT